MRALWYTLLLSAVAVLVPGCPHSFARPERPPADRSVVVDRPPDRPADRSIVEGRDGPAEPDLQAPLTCLVPPCVTTLAGRCTQYGRLDGSLTQARFKRPYGLALKWPLLAVADSQNAQIRAIDLDLRQVTTLAGSGGTGMMDGPAALAAFNSPEGVTFSPAGSIVVADAANYRVREIKDGQVATVAGSKDDGEVDGPALQAQFERPRGLLFAPGLGLLIADCAGARIRWLDGDQVKTFAGSSPGWSDGAISGARFNQPCGLALDPAKGSIIVADTANHRIRAIEAGKVTTLAGSYAGHKDGAAATALFSSPRAAAVVGPEDLLVVDSDNHCIRRIKQGTVTTWAGMCAAGKYYYGYLDGPADQARFNAPTDIAVDASGTVYIADSGNHCIRQVR